jgi:hypothetical protein
MIVMKRISTHGLSRPVFGLRRGGANSLCCNGTVARPLRPYTGKMASGSGVDHLPGGAKALEGGVAETV